MYLNLYSVFEARARAFPDKTALIEDRRVLTYSELDEEVNRLADALYEKNIRRGSKLAFLIGNGILYAELILACQKLGIIAILCNYRLTPEETAHYLSFSKADAVVLPQDYKRFSITVNNPNISGIRCFIGGDSDSVFDGTNQMIRKGNPAFSYAEDTNPDDEAVYIFTGGTSGEPKAAVHTNQSILMNTLLHHYGVNPYLSTDVFLNYAPLYHWGGFSILLNILVAGGTFIILKRFDAEEVYRQIKENHATHIFLLPVNVVQDLVKIPQFRAEDMRSVKRINLGGYSGRPKSILKLFDIFVNAKITIGYGMTENACSIVQVLSKEILSEHPEYIKSVGKPAFECSVKLIGSDGKEVLRGETGELYAASLGQFKGYLGKESPFVNGYFPTGDMFRQDEEGNFYFVDRAKEMIRSGGENVYSIEVENILSQHEAVAECAVVAVPHTRYEEAVGAAVCLKENCSATEQELIDFCRKRLAHYKCPKQIRFYPGELPRTDLGKINKKRIRKDFSAPEQFES